jgi:hypothetical protein
VKPPPLSKHIPECSYGAVLVTARAKIVRRNLATGRCLIKVLPVNKGETIEPFPQRNYAEDYIEASKLENSQEHSKYSLVMS